MKIPNNFNITTTYLLMLKLGTFAFICILACLIISNLSLLSPNWPFALFASFSETLIFALPVVIGAILLSWRKAVLPVILFAAFAFYPFYSFKKFVKPTQNDCLASDCASIVAVNLRHHPEALLGLAQTDANNADLIIIVELPYRTTSEELLTLFPMDGKAQIALITEPHLKLGSRLAVISRKPLDDITLQLKQFPVSQLRHRGIVKFDYEMSSGQPISFVVVHSPPPKGRAETASRDAYLREASRSLSYKSNFIMIGDFNMTPWEPGFAILPGKRAGNPRWSHTWNARKFWQRITIDHALVGDGVEVTEAKTLQDVGSDHFPISIIVKSK